MKDQKYEHQRIKVGGCKGTGWSDTGFSLCGG